MIKYDFNEKNVIVTGAAMGLGKSIAEEFAKAHANVVIADINLEEASKTAMELEKYNVKTMAYQINVSKYEEFEVMVEEVIRRLGRIDILVNNAGICILEPTETMDMKKMDSIIDVDLKGSLYGCCAVLKEMRKQKYGKIINMSSIAAKLAGSCSVAYSSSKAAIIALTASLAREYAKDNININCILPGIIRTPLWEEMLNQMSKDDLSKKDEVFTSYTNTIPTGRPQDPVDIANAVLFLSSDESYNITGQNLGVDGGQTF